MPIRFPRLPEERSGVSERMLQSVLKKVNATLRKKRMKDDILITTLGDSVFSKPRSYVSSGILPLDCILCYGMGFPSGIIELFGNEASGKTAILENALAEAQHDGFYTVLFPTEYSLDYKRVNILHLKEEQLIIGDAETIEDVYDQIKMIVRGIREKDLDTPIVIGWDSIAATPTRRELQAKAGLEDNTMGHTALRMSTLFRRLVKFLFVNKVCLICINQTRTNLGVMFGNKETTFGGKALRFYAWIRVRVAKTKPIDEDGENVGFICEARTVKNKVAPPLQVCKIPIYWNRGVDRAMSVWEYAVDKEVFTKNGTAYRYRNQIVTRRSFQKFYDNHKREIDAALRVSVRER